MCFRRESGASQSSSIPTETRCAAKKINATVDISNAHIKPTDSKTDRWMIPGRQSRTGPACPSVVAIDALCIVWRRVITVGFALMYFSVPPQVGNN